jgi:uncharacterized protein involved in outer membrane biogenesis
MRRVLLISGLAVAGVVIIMAALTGYAVYNLTALITYHQKRILNQVSDALGRPLEVGAIKAKVGLGLAIEVDGLKIADDPSFSNTPFLTAAQASFDVEFLPLLRGRVKVVSLELTQPSVRILKNADGFMNVDSIRETPTSGSAGGLPSPSIPGSRKHRAFREIMFAAVHTLSVKSFGIQEGTVYYSDPALKGAPLQINHLIVELNGFHTGSAFDVEVSCALFSEHPNMELSGKMGPLLRNGVVDLPNFALDLKFDAGPVTVDNLRTLATPGAVIPAVIALPDPLTGTGTISGTLQNVVIAASSDLSAYRVLYRAASNQAGGAPLILNVTGKNALRGTLKPLQSKPDHDLTVTMSQVALKFEGAQLPAISNLNTAVHLTSKGIAVEPTSFTVGGGQASVEASANSIRPLDAAFSVKADSLQLSQIVPRRPPGEFVNQLTISGTAGGDISAPVVKMRIKSARGYMERLAFDNLDLTGTYADRQISAQPLSISVFDGSVVGNINAVLAEPPPFNASLSFNHVNMPATMEWLGVHSHALTGFLTGNANLSGSGRRWHEIEPTMRGSGRVFISGGRLEGVNIVAIALDKIAAAPVVSQLVNVAFRSSHQGLFADSSTDMRQASMSFTLTGPRVTTPDLLIQSPEYEITGAGWFDFNKNINMSGDIKLTLGLSAAIPLVVMGRYPALLVLPDIPKLAERVAVGVVSAPVNILKGGVHGLGSVFGGIKSILP